MARSIFGLTSLIFVAAALLFMFFILLAGAVNGSPVDRWYFLEADTSGIPTAPSISRWTLWNPFGGESSIPFVRPAYPLDPPRNFGTTTGVPTRFVGTHYYYLMTRFMFAFALISLFFTTCALFTGLLALCTRIGAYLSGLLTTIALIFQALMASLMTAAYLKGRNAFRDAGLQTRIGTYAFGFEWAAFACLFISTVLFCLGGSAGKKDNYSTKTRGGFFKGKRSKSTRSRGSFINADKEYA